MLTYHPHRQRGAWKINTAQALIILIALGCAAVVYNAYQKSRDTSVVPSDVTTQDPKLAAYTAQVTSWQAELIGKYPGMVVTWPYLGQDDAVRIDLPKQQPITLAPWDAGSIQKVTLEAYNGFVRVRKKAHVLNPQGCLVHVFEPNPNGEFTDEAATGSASGVELVQQD